MVLAVLIAFGVHWLRRGPTHESRHASAVFLAVLAAVPCLCLTVARTDFREPRYLLPVYLGIAPLVGGLLSALWQRRLALTAMAAVLLALNLGSQLQSARLEGKLRAAERKDWIDSDPREVAGHLEEKGVDAVYASYWVATGPFNRSRVSRPDTHGSGVAEHYERSAELASVPRRGEQLCRGAGRNADAKPNRAKRSHRSARCSRSRAPARKSASTPPSC